MPRYRSAVMSASLLAMALAGCNKSPQDMNATSANTGLPPLPAALPMLAGPASQIIPAPPVSALPVRHYVGLSRPSRERESYAYLDRASDVQDEIGDAPPDYGYDNNDGVSPWVWQTNGGDYRYAEPADDGYRDYYYQPGADDPYLVRTRDHSYAYAGGALVAIYLINGALLPPEQYGGYRDEASRYFWRGQQLRQAADQRPHQGVIAANWAAQRPQFSAAQASWAAARSQQAAWQAYHARNDPSQQPGWQQEHQQRQQVAQQFAGWQSRGLAGAPPAVLAAVGALAAMPRAARQPGVILPNEPPSAVLRQPAIPGQQGFAGPEQSHRRDMASPQGVAPMAGPIPNNGVQAAAVREQQLAAQREAQRQAVASQQQALASQRAEQEAGRARQQAAALQQAAVARQQQLAARTAAQQQALASQRTEQEASRARQQTAALQQAAAARQQQLAARTAAQQQALASQRAEQEAGRARQQAAAQQQMIANVHRQQEMAAQEQVAAQRHEALMAAHQAQLHALAAQKQAEVARTPAVRPEAKPPASHAQALHEAPRPDPGHEKDRHEP